MQQIGQQDLDIPGIRWYDLAMADRFWRRNILLQGCGILSLAHVPDTSPRVAKASGQYADGQLFYFPASMYTVVSKKMANTFRNTE